MVVGYDGSAGAGAAVTWAALEAASRGVRLTVLFAADVIGSVLATPTVLSRDARAAGHGLAEEGAALARQVEGEGAGLEVVTEVHLTGPAAALVEVSSAADLVVVGNRGRGAIVGALLGSVAFSVTSRAGCPVVVVRGEHPRRPGPGLPVVVGVDGSAGARSAVDVAAGMAARLGAALVTLVAWRLPESGAGGSAFETGFLPDVTARAKEEAGRRADAAAARARVAHPGLEVGVSVVHDRPDSALTDASVDAGLVVVGARGYSSVGGLFIGSVSHATIHAASCPVAVVRSDGDR